MGREDTKTRDSGGDKMRKTKRNKSVKQTEALYIASSKQEDHRGSKEYKTYHVVV